MRRLLSHTTNRNSEHQRACVLASGAGTSCQEAVCQTSLQQMGPGWSPGWRAGVRGHIPEARARFRAGAFGC